MKRIETILAAAALLLALGACQKASEPTPAAPDSAAASAAAPQEPASAVPAPSEPAAPASAASQ